jgi:hypothetical protein
MRRIAFVLTLGLPFSASLIAAAAKLEISAVGSTSVESAVPVFAQKSDMIRVRVSNVPWPVGRAQLAHRFGDRGWVTAGNSELVSNRTVEAHFPLPGGCERNPIEVVAILSAAGIPKGQAFTPGDLIGLRYVSLPVLISCAAGTGTVRILSVANHAVTPDRELHVARIEQLRVSYEGGPEGAFLQIVVIPDEAGGTVWAMDDWRVTRSANAIEQFSVYFGRTGASRERDLYRTFTAYGMLMRRAFPVRGENGMTASEFRDYAHGIIAISRPVRVIRSLPMDGLAIRIDSLGSADFGDRFLAHPLERVEGLVTAGQNYHPPKQNETVALLIRKIDEPAWEVAGMTRLTPNDLTRWVITVAHLTSSGVAKGQDEYRAMAVVLPGTVALKSRVTDAILEDALAISDEVRYHVISGGN